MADDRWPFHDVARDGRPDHETLLALYPALLRPVHATTDWLGDEGARAIAAGSRRPAGRVRRCRTPLHVGQSFPRARASPLAVRTGPDPRHQWRQAAHERRVVHADGDAWLVTRDLPSKGRQLAPRLLARLPVGSSARVGATLQGREAGGGKRDAEGDSREACTPKTR